MTQYNDTSTVSRQIADLRREIMQLATQPRAISTSIDRGGTQSSDYDGTGINNPGTRGWKIGTDETTGVGYVHINGRIGGIFATANSKAAQDALVASISPTVNQPLGITRTDTTSAPIRFTTDGVMWQKTVPAPVEYIEPTLGAGVTNYLGPYHKTGYLKTSQGIVCITGLVNATPGNTFFTLPVGYRPSNDIITPVVNGASTGLVRIFASTGQVLFSGGGATYVTLSSIMFPAAGVATWTPVTSFNTGWSSYHTVDAAFGQLAYWRDPLGRVWFNGMVRQNTPSTLGADTAMFSVPFGKNLFSHYPGLGNGGFGGIHIDASATVFAKTGMVTNWITTDKLMFPDSNVRNDWLTNSMYYNSWAKYPNAIFPERRYMTFQDGIVVQDGLMASGVIGAGVGGVSQQIVDGTAPDVQRDQHSNRTGTEIFTLAANNAIARTDAYGFGPFGAAPYGWSENSGSNAWRSYGGVNYLVGA